MYVALALMVGAIALGLTGMIKKEKGLAFSNRFSVRHISVSNDNWIQLKIPAKLAGTLFINI